MICSKNVSYLMLTKMAVLVIFPIGIPGCSVAGLSVDCPRQACWDRVHQATCMCVRLPSGPVVPALSRCPPAWGRQRAGVLENTEGTPGKFWEPLS